MEVVVVVSVASSNNKVELRMADLRQGRTRVHSTRVTQCENYQRQTLQNLSHLYLRAVIFLYCRTTESSGAFSVLN